MVPSFQACIVNELAHNFCCASCQIWNKGNFFFFQEPTWLLHQAMILEKVLRQKSDHLQGFFPDLVFVGNEGSCNRCSELLFSPLSFWLRLHFEVIQLD